MHKLAIVRCGQPRFCFRPKAAIPEQTMTEDSKKCAQCAAELPDDSVSSLCARCLLQIGFETQQQDGSGEPQATGDYQPTFIPPTAEELAPQFPQLEILEVIGHGGMGVVYKARQTELDRIVALKILRPGISTDPNFAERFQREARALAKLNHPNIITVFDFGRRDALFYFIMEFVDGTNLRHLERVGQLNPAEALRIVPQICSALQYAHDNGVVHRDIKPENILIGTDGDVRIADFGLAKLAGNVDKAPLTGTWQVMGTPHYMAPEQFEKPTTVDHRADIYSLGVVIYELLTGELPLGRFPLPSEKASVDVRLDEVVLRSLDKEPERRYQHVTDVATAVEEASTPRGESKLEQAKEWVRDKAGDVSDGAKSLKEKLPSLKPDLSGWTAALQERRRGIGTLLILCGIADVILALVFHGELGTRPGNDLTEFLTFMTIVAGAVAFWFGRKLRAERVNGGLKILAIVGLIPWFGFPPVSLFRAILVGLGLWSTTGLSEDDASEKDPSDPDMLDRMLDHSHAIWRVVTLRTVFFTLIGIAGWAGVCALSFGVLYDAWYQHHVPSHCYIHDETGADLKPASGAYPELQIDASETLEAHGFRRENRSVERTRLTLTIPDGPVLNVDLATGLCHMMIGREPLREAMPIEPLTVRDWLSQCGVDADDDSVSAEVMHLTEAILLMEKTRGVCDRVSIKDRQEFPTLHAGITAILQDSDVMHDNLIPVGRLLDPELFSGGNNRKDPFLSLSPNQFAEHLYFGILTAIAVLGLLRIIRVLYVHLLKPSLRETSDDAVHASEGTSIWRRCTIGLFLLGTLTALGCLGLYELTAQVFDETAEFRFLGGTFSKAVVMQVMMTFMVLAATIAGCALLARPLLKALGWWVGAAGATLAVLAIPLSLITYPTGLAAWIRLTDRSVRSAFGATPPQQSADVATAATTAVP